MKATIPVNSRDEGEAIRKGLEDPATRAIVVIMGALSTLDNRARIRVLTYVRDYFDDERTGATSAMPEMR
jgi:hypothetical protein